MNTKVTATGMQVQAKSNSTFLLINDNNAAHTGSQEKNWNMAATAVYPAKAYLADSTKDPVTSETFTPTNITTKALANAPANWYTANSKDPADFGGVDTTATGKLFNVTQLNSNNINFGDYVIKKTVYLTLQQNSTKANNLSVTPTITTQSGVATDSSAVTVLVVSDNDQVAVLTGANNGVATNLYSSTNNNDIVDSACHAVDIYIYYDGTAGTVTTNNRTDLAGATISLDFSVSVNE